MRVRFANRRLERGYADEREASRRWGPVVGLRYRERVGLLYAVANVSRLYELRTLDFHALTGNYAGRHALRLTGRWRLIVTVDDEEHVTVEEVTDYHG